MTDPSRTTPGTSGRSRSGLVDHPTSRLLRLAAGILGLLLGPMVEGMPIAAAQSFDTEPCTGLVSSNEARVQPAAFRPGPASGPSSFARALALQAGEVGLTFIGHSTFLIESPGGVRIATDYNDSVRPSVTPDVVTMNHAHGTHYTNHPDPAIKHVLRGWGQDGQPARWDVTVGDVRIRNVATNIRDFGGGTEEFGNSIFVFEMGGLCVAHLGHLHHTLLPGHLRQIGRIDVLLVPVDGSYTMDVDGMVEVMQSIHAPLMIPMHIFGQGTLERFLARVGQAFPVQRAASPELVVSRASLPSTPTVLVLPGR